MKEILLLLKDYWFLILFALGGIMLVWNAIKKKIPFLEKRVGKIETQIFDKKGNGIAITKDMCKEERDICSGNICFKLDKLENIIRGTSKDTKESIEKSERLASASIKDLHEKREATTKEIKGEITSVVGSINTQINTLTLTVGKVQGELSRIKTGSVL